MLLVARQRVRAACIVCDCEWCAVRGGGRERVGVRMPLLVPIGYYALGMRLLDGSSTGGAVVWRSRVNWMPQAVKMARPGTRVTFDVQVETPSWLASVHVWGMARLVRVLLGARQYGLDSGALCVPTERPIQPGEWLRVEVEALPLSDSEVDHVQSR